MSKLNYSVAVQTYMREGDRPTSRIVERFKTNIPAANLDDAHAIRAAMQHTETTTLERLVQIEVSVRFGPGSIRIPVDQLEFCARAFQEALEEHMTTPTKPRLPGNAKQRLSNDSHIVKAD